MEPIKKLSVPVYERKKKQNIYICALVEPMEPIGTDKKSYRFRLKDRNSKV